MLCARDILGDNERQQDIMTLLDSVHRCVDRMARQMLGEQTTQEEREALIQRCFMQVAVRADHLYRMNLSQQMFCVVKSMRMIILEEARHRNQKQMVEKRHESDERLWETSQLTEEQIRMMQKDEEEKRCHMQAALARLTERDRKILVEKFKNDLSDVAIGLMMGITPRNVRIYAERARYRFAIYYDEEVKAAKRRKGREDRRFHR